MTAKQPQRVSFVSKMICCLMGVGLLVSAFGVIYTKHLTRQLFTQLQLLEQEAESLQIEWRQLLVEQGTWTTDERVERIAKERLHMRVPEPNQIVVITQPKQSSSTT